MDRDEAERLAERLGREHEDRDTHAWFAREGEGGAWSVVKVGRPGSRIDPVKATVEAKPKPPQQEDPRSAHARILPYNV